MQYVTFMIGPPNWLRVLWDADFMRAAAITTAAAVAIAAPLFDESFDVLFVVELFVEFEVFVFGL